jgi:hypothetical protein
MAAPMKETISTARKTVTENISGLMVALIKAIGIVISFMDKGFTLGKMEEDIKAIGFKEKWKEKENTLGRMENNMKEII